MLRYLEGTLEQILATRACVLEERFEFGSVRVTLPCGQRVRTVWSRSV